MIVIVAKNIVKAGKKQDFINAAQDLIKGSKAEALNISYDLFEDISDENVVTFIEEWQDREAIKVHNEMPHYKEGVAAIREFVESNEVRLYNKL